MIYPFTAKVAEAKTHEFGEKWKQTRNSLLEAYLRIAEVQVERATMRGHCGASVYIPFEISTVMVETLEEAGFEVTQLTKNSFPSSFYHLSWGV